MKSIGAPFRVVAENVRGKASCYRHDWLAGIAASTKMPFAEGSDYGNFEQCILLAGDIEMDGNECPVHVLDTTWAVPEIPSPPTASALNGRQSSSSWNRTMHLKIS
ncbi:hypothetical protein AgCh_023728 [Apium graveolens]